jgi:hypothetical protein
MLDLTDQAARHLDARRQLTTRKPPLPPQLLNSLAQTHAPSDYSRWTLAFLIIPDTIF